MNNRKMYLQPIEAHLVVFKGALKDLALVCEPPFWLTRIMLLAGRMCLGSMPNNIF